MFTVIRGKLDPHSTWSNNAVVSDTRLGTLEIVAASIAQTVLVYGWDLNGRLVERACDVADANDRWGPAAVVPHMPRCGQNCNLGITRTAGGICLLYSGASQHIWWRHRDSECGWGKAKGVCVLTLTEPLRWILTVQLLQQSSPRTSISARQCPLYHAAKVPGVPDRVAADPGHPLPSRGRRRHPRSRTPANVMSGSPLPISTSTAPHTSNGSTKQEIQRSRPTGSAGSTHKRPARTVPTSRPSLSSPGCIRRPSR